MKRVLAAAAALAVLAAGVLWFLPFELHVGLLKAGLRLGGAAPVTAGSLSAYERSTCVAGAPCRCVALVHGMGDTALTWNKLMLGGDGAPPPPAGVRVLAVNMPGTDGSAPSADYGIRAQSRVLRAALEARCPRWTVAGNSLGGWMAGWLAVDWPQGVERLVLVNAAGLTDPTEQALATARLLAAPTIPEMKAFSARAYAVPKPVPERAWPAVIASIRSRPTAAILAALTLDDVLDARLKDVKAETVVVWGASDRVLPAGFAGRFAKGIRGAKLVEIAACGHLPQQECPGPVARAVFGAP
ncbi:MAG: alpha/beta hydrolase [Elusimicrobiota bacterium]|nr:MAG: alpha/beta hydrolase [Elusimicrobiota bacterium]